MLLYMLVCLLLAPLIHDLHKHIIYIAAYAGNERISKHLRAFPWQLPVPPPEPSFHKMHHLSEFQVCNYETFVIPRM